jgi:hypothetical protein
MATRRIAPKLTRDSGWMAIEQPTDGSYTFPLRAQDGDLLTFGKRKIALCYWL